MKKIIYTLAILIALGISNQSMAQEPVSTKTASKTQTPQVVKKKKTKKVKPPPPEPFAEFAFDEETHDFGNVPNGPDVMCEFKFKNTGNTPLIITSATAGCGCTVPEPPKDPIAPGKTGVIKVIYHTSGRVGPISKGITVISNSKSQPTKMIFIKGTVNP